MIKKRLLRIKNNFRELGIDGYIVPKNDEFFSEYSQKDRLKFISNFSGSAGCAIILKNKNYLFIDGRYTIQAQIESKKNFSIVDYHKIIDCKLFKNLTLGVDPKLITSTKIKMFFNKYNKIKIIEHNLIDKIFKKKSIPSKPFFSLNLNAAGESCEAKINRTVNFLKKNKSDYIFISAPENVAWLLNIRGFDCPNSPIPNCHLLLDKKKNFWLIGEKNKFKQLLKDKKIYTHQIINPKSFEKFIVKKEKKQIIIDHKTCSLFYERILREKFNIKKIEDPIYLMKSIKNKVEIRNTIESHIADGIALTKFLYWIKKVNKKKITEFDAQNKLEKFRKENQNYLYPSFNTIAGSGKNGAIVHYRADKKSSKIIKKNDIFLCDSGGQYKYGTTDVTRTICFQNQKKNIKDIFTKVLRGHIAVANNNFDRNKYGKLIDFHARKFLKKINLDYSHGTGHGVGYFLNVHEGPQSISKYNNIKLSEGMILSNEPGYYKKGHFGIRIENLIFIKKTKNKLFFENLTLAPIDKDLIDFKQLNVTERNYLFQYHLTVYQKLAPFLNKNEKKWLASHI